MYWQSQHRLVAWNHQIEVETCYPLCDLQYCNQWRRTNKIQDMTHRYATVLNSVVTVSSRIKSRCFGPDKVSREPGPPPLTATTAIFTQSSSRWTSMQGANCLARFRQFGEKVELLWHFCMSIFLSLKMV
jgi:hypothetical protein